MTGPDREHLEQRLRSLREQQADGVRTREMAREIATVAGRLGFDPDEAAAIADQIEAPASGPGHAMAGDYRVLLGSAAPILTFSALVIAGAVAGLGQPVAGGLIVLAVAILWIIGARRRVARLRISASGALSFPGRLDRFDPSELLSIDFAYRYPPWAARLDRAASETVDLRLRLNGNRSIKLGRGPLWRVQPAREPVAYSQLERHLAAQARDAGLTIERHAAGWRARRAGGSPPP